ncbi:hypothetical protein R6Q59_021485 [Mikania micrantha]
MKGDQSQFVELRGRPQNMFSDTTIQLQSVFAQWIHKTHALAPGAIAPSAIASTRTADFLVHHIHAFTIHVTVLILLKSVLFARNSRLIPDKENLGFRFPGAIASTRTADFLVHHIHAFTIHVTVLILLKSVLFARNSRLIPDKENLGFRFPCDEHGQWILNSNETSVCNLGWIISNVRFLLLVKVNSKGHN